MKDRVYESVEDFYENDPIGKELFQFKKAKKPTLLDRIKITRLTEKDYKGWKEDE